jgi:hypothetical protein
MLYWIVYHLDLGRLGPKLLDLAVRRWLKRANEHAAEPRVRRQPLGSLTALHLQPSFGADERM